MELNKLHKAIKIAAAASIAATTLGAQSSFANTESKVGLEEIVVSARKRNEDIIDVPMSITAVGEVEIQKRNAITKEDLYRTIAGAAAPRGQLILRGLSGGNDAYPGTTTTFTDGVPFDFSDLYDVERVEVLRGPQGTLWGSNAIGGTVQVITKQPELGAFEVFGSTQFTAEENRDGVAVNGYMGINMPIGDSAAIRITGSANNEPGKIYNAATGNLAKKEGHWTRAQALWEVTDEITTTASYVRTYDYQEGYFYTDRSTPDGYYTMTLTPDANEVFGYAVGYDYVDCQAGQERAACRQSAPHRNGQDPKFTVWELLDQWNEWETDLYRFGFEHDNLFDLASLTYVTSYRDVEEASLDNWSRLDANDLFKTWIINNDTSIDAGTRWTHELRLNSINPDSPLQWTVGYFYDKHDNSNVPDYQYQYHQGDDNQQSYAKANYWWWWVDYYYGMRPDEFGSTLYGDPNKNYNINQEIWWQKEQALFGEVSYLMSFANGHELEATAGIRYFEIKDHYKAVESGIWVGANAAVSDDRSTTDGNRKKFSLSYRPGNDMQYYGLYSEGYRPGGTNMPALPFACQGDPNSTNFGSTYGSDEIENWEAGIKGSLMEDRFRFAGAAYRINWEGVQTSIYMDTCGFSYYANAGSARSQGLEWESSFQATDNLGFIVNASYTDSEILEDDDSIGAQAGDDMTMVPKYNFYLAADYDYSMFGKAVSTRLAVSGYDEYKSHFNTKEEDVAPKYSTWDLSTTIEASDNVKLGIHVNNLLNEEIITYKRSRSRSNSNSAAKYVYYGDERSVSIRADFIF